MGKLENEVKKKRIRKNLQSVILKTVAMSGVLTMALVTPNALKSMKSIGLPINKRQAEYLSSSRGKLIRNGYLEKDSNNKLRLTRKGKNKLKYIERNYYYKPKRTKKWDKRWRILIFDIPEKQRQKRDKVRNTLQAIGFHRLQNSVWIYPYDCEDLITLIKADFRIGKDLLYLIVEKMEYDAPIRKHFCLPNA